MAQGPCPLFLAPANPQSPIPNPPPLVYPTPMSLMLSVLLAISENRWMRERGPKLWFVRRAVRVEGNAHHQGVRLPLLQQGSHPVEARIAFGTDGGLRLGLTQQAVAHGHTRALETEIQSEKGLLCSRNGGHAGRSGAHAWPA